MANVPVALGLSSVTLWGLYLAYGSMDERIVVCDLRTGRVTTVAAKAKGSAKVFDYTVGSDNVVVWSTLATTPEAVSNEKTGWTIEAMDLRSGKRRLVAEGADTYRWLPRPRVDWPWIVWSERPDGDNASAIRVFNLRDGRLRTVVPASMKPSGAKIVDGVIVFAGDNDSSGRDLFTVPADGSAPPHQLTSQGYVTVPSVANGRVAWQNSGPSRPVDRWTMVLGRDPEPVQVPIVVINLATLVPGPDFLIAHESSVDPKPLTLFDIAHPSTPPLPLFDTTTETVDIGAHWDVYDDLVVWVTFESPIEATPRRHLHIARVVRG